MQQLGAVVAPEGNVMIAPAEPKLLEPHGGFSFESG
jgi:hypothetical protein